MNRLMYRDTFCCRTDKFAQTSNESLDVQGHPFFIVLETTHYTTCEIFSITVVLCVSLGFTQDNFGIFHLIFLKYFCAEFYVWVLLLQFLLLIKTFFFLLVKSYIDPSSST
jgi:hypothetical protein